jgi:hypothetical protein
MVEQRIGETMLIRLLAMMSELCYESPFQRRGGKS